MKKKYSIKSMLIIFVFALMTINLVAQEDKTIVLISGGEGKGAPYVEDEAAIVILEDLGYTVEILVVSGTIPDVSVLDDFDGIVISSSISSGDFAPAFVDGPGLPVLAWEYGIFDEMSLGTAGTHVVSAGTEITIVSEEHYISGELTDEVEVFSEAIDFSAVAMGTVAPGAEVVAMYEDISGVEQACIVAVDVDGELSNGELATERRVGFYFNSNFTIISDANDESLELFENAILWMMGDDEEIIIEGISPKQLGFDLKCSPNPVVGSSIISFTNSSNSNISLNLINSLGQNITAIYNGKMNAGTHQIKWDNNVAQGIYLLQLQVNENIQMIKVSIK